MKQNNNDTKSFSGKIIPENIGKEVKKMTRRERYLYERENGKIVVFDERYIGSSELVEDIINGRNLMTALRKALQLLNEYPTGTTAQYLKTMLLPKGITDTSEIKTTDC